MAASSFQAKGQGVWHRLRAYADMVVFSNTLFSLSFGLIAIVLASQQVSSGPGGWTLVWVLVALLAGRTGANAFNRLADKDIDGHNPRTANRHLPASTLSAREVWLFNLGCLVVLVVAAASLSLLCLALLPLALGVIVLYSYAKRFTWLCHVILGVASAAAPLGAWLAITGGVSAQGWLLAFVNLFWVAGFDVIYAIQDIDFDRRLGLYSIPARFGARAALNSAALMHGLMWMLLCGLAYVSGWSWLFYAGLLLVALLVSLQHHLARKAVEHMEFASMGLSRIISVLLLLFILVQVYL